jgi:hydrogenase maturation protein HypF
VAALRRFRLPGNERAVREPRRAALGLLHELLGEAAFDARDLPPVAAFTAAELSVVRRMLDRGLNAPWTSSAGRLFDAVAALAGLRHVGRFEGQAAMELEFAAGRADGGRRYPVEIAPPPAEASGPWSPRWVVDWGPVVGALIAERRRGATVESIAAAFHETLAEAIVEVARRAGEERVVLTGGCFQNRLLTERAVERLGAAGFRPYWHQRIPPNDGGLALGQAAAAALALRAQRAPAAAEGAEAPVSPDRS